MFESIRPGDRVTIFDRFGQTRTGRAVMRGPHGWVINLGGRHGTPGIATPENVVRVRKARPSRRSWLNPQSFRLRGMPKARNARGRKFIRGAIKRPGALRARFAQWFGLKQGGVITASMYRRGLARARKMKRSRSASTARLGRRIERQIHFAQRVLRPAAARAAAKRRRAKMRALPTRRRRRKVANIGPYPRTRGRRLLKSGYLKPKRRVGGKSMTWKQAVRKWGVVEAAKKWRRAKAAA